VRVSEETSQSPRFEWEPNYIVWALSIFVSTFIAVVLAALVMHLLLSGGSGNMLTTFGVADVSFMQVVVFVGAIIGISVLPGMLSLFLISLTDVPLSRHPLIGAAGFGVVGGMMAQSLSIAGAAFLFGLVSLGGSTAILALHRRYAKQSYEGRRHG